MGMPLRSINLNLLPVLQALLREQSVTRAARALNLSQPATSNALARLRGLLGDPLLVSVGRELRPTPRALALLPQVDLLCGGLESMLSNPAFDPASAKRHFVVAAADYVALLAGAALLSVFRETAPGITVQFVDVRPGFAAKLLAGQGDLAVLVPEGDIVRGLTVSHRTFADRIVAVMHRDHPLTQGRPTLADFQAWPELRWQWQPEGEASESLPKPAWFPSGGPTRLLTEQFIVLPLLAAQSDAVAFVPARLAAFFSALVAIAVLEVPGSHGFEARAVWSPTQDADPGHRWFRETLQDTLTLPLQLPT